MVSLRNAFVMTAPLLCAGCNPAFWGNLGVLGVTIAIFLGTVFLSRSSEASRSAARSASSTARANPLTVTVQGSASASSAPATKSRASTSLSGRSGRS